ncbi:hypothetical protein V6N12_037430 [Hibiscus sabdariffa]|uniref:Uncharacterized protein n=1 Tax=Hibiscus sabdariffa TaxID=183260 RepID=A0ABR2ATX4_9ROSI
MKLKHTFYRLFVNTLSCLLAPRSDVDQHRHYSHSLATNQTTIQTMGHDISSVRTTTVLPSVSQPVLARLQTNYSTNIPMKGYDVLVDGAEQKPLSDL